MRPRRLPARLVSSKRGVELLLPYLAAVALAIAVLSSIAAAVGPFGVARALGAALGVVVGQGLRVRRRHVIESVRRAGIQNADAVADGMYRCLGQGLGELICMAVRPRGPLPDGIEIDEAVRRLLAARRGIVLATAHTGNWDLMACAVAAQVPLTVVTKRLSIGMLDRFWQNARARRGVRLVSAGAAGLVARRALADGQAVAMIIDQAPERTRGVMVTPFLAQLAEVDLAPAFVAMRARVPLALVVAERLPHGRHRAVLLAKFDPPARPCRDWAVESMRQATAALEAHVRGRPEQWLWMHRRWKRHALGAGITAFGT